MERLKDSANFKRRTFQARIGEAQIRIHGYRTMKVIHWAFPFVLKPMVAWLMGKLKFYRR